MTDYNPSHGLPAAERAVRKPVSNFDEAMRRPATEVYRQAVEEAAQGIGSALSWHTSDRFVFGGRKPTRDGLN